MINVFISHPTPYNEKQAEFLSLLNEKLLLLELNPINLGKNNWDYRSPLIPIKEMIANCKAAIIVGMERHHSYIGYEKEFTKDSKEWIHRYSSSPWIQIEAGMAYQAGLPLLILKEKRVASEGILDASIGQYSVFEYEMEDIIDSLPTKIDLAIRKWASYFKV